MTKIVAIDAGHGMNTPGKRTPDDEREWSFNKQVVESATKYLQEYENVKVIRLDDPTGKRDVPLKERTDKANRENADVLISVHHNANTGRWGNWTGTETYTYVTKLPRTERLAKLVHDRVVKAYGLRDRGLKKANFHMLRESRMDAILIEGGFMDSTIDIQKLRNKQVLDKAGKAIAEGVAEFLNLKKKAKPKPKPSKTTGKLYKVQIGAYKNKANADQQAFRAKGRGFDQYVVRQGGLYKVQIGAYANKKNAEAQADKARKAGFDVYIEGAGQGKTAPKPKKFKVGQKVKIKSSAKKYSRANVTIPARVKGKSYTIQQISKDDVLLKEINSWVKKSDLK